MVISDKYKYLFIEVPRTGSTAISRELIEYYYGRKILHKHANYKEFLRQADQSQKDYFVFSGVRNPLDATVSEYSKLLCNHRSAYTDPDSRLKNGGWVSEKRVEMFKFVQKHKDFKQYLQKYQKFVYTNNINVNKKYCDYIIRFENLDAGFAEVLSMIQVSKKRPLPIVNKTINKRNYLEYFDNEMADIVVRRFGPFMEEWGYSLPKELYIRRVNTLGRTQYRFMKFARTLYINHVQSGALQKVTILRNRLE